MSDTAYRPFEYFLQVMDRHSLDPSEFILGLSLDNEPITLIHSLAYGRSDNRRPALIHVDQPYSAIAEFVAAQFLARNAPVVIGRSTNDEVSLFPRCSSAEGALYSERMGFDPDNAGYLAETYERVLIVVQDSVIGDVPDRLIMRPNTLIFYLSGDQPERSGLASLTLSHRNGEFYRYRRPTHSGLRFRPNESSLNIIGPEPPYVTT